MILMKKWELKKERKEFSKKKIQCVIILKRKSIGLISVLEIKPYSFAGYSKNSRKSIFQPWKEY